MFKSLPLRYTGSWNHRQSTLVKTCCAWACRCQWRISIFRSTRSERIPCSYLNVFKKHSVSDFPLVFDNFSYPLLRSTSRLFSLHPNRTLLLALASLFCYWWCGCCVYICNLLHLTFDIFSKALQNWKWKGTSRSLFKEKSERI